jgi:hypothetical protein
MVRKTPKKSLTARKTVRRIPKKQPSKKTMKPVKKAPRARAVHKASPRVTKRPSSETPYVPLPDDVEVKSYIEANIKDVCAYCKHRFAKNELVIEKEVHGRTWRFCSDACYYDFMDAVHFQDEDKDSYGNMTVTGQRDEL